MIESACTNRVILDQWHSVARLEEVSVGIVAQTRLLGEELSYTRNADGQPIVWRTCQSRAESLPVRPEYLYLWTSLGSPTEQLFEIPEFAEPDRRNVHGGTIGVNVSAPRAIENFLDMGHFPFVHTDILGVEPHTEVAEYEVHTDLETNDVWATGCVFWQPVAATTATEGQMSDYMYRVRHPYCVILYKTAPIDPTRMDVIGLFRKSMAPDYVEANMFLSLLDAENSDSVIRRFQQTIFAQDKSILESQHPKRLPLDPRAKTPVRADKVAIAYRRWLSDLGLTYGVIPAA